MNDTDFCSCCGCERPRRELDALTGACDACDREVGNTLFDSIDVTTGDPEDL